jgi:hypothetical protein
MKSPAASRAALLLLLPRFVIDIAQAVYLSLSEKVQSPSGNI